MRFRTFDETIGLPERGAWLGLLSRGDMAQRAPRALPPRYAVRLAWLSWSRGAFARVATRFPLTS